MRIHLVRHSVPDLTPDDDGKVPDDPSLSDEGRDIVKRLAKKLSSDDNIPSAIYASPSARTQETAEILRDILGLDDVKTVDSIGPNQSIRGLVQKLAKQGVKNPMIVSHHESIHAGLRTLSIPDEPDLTIHADPLAKGEMRTVRMKRKNGKWKECCRIMPSDLDKNAPDAF